MPVRQIDPARLEGEELRRWYQRTPDEIEQERQAAYDQRYNAFYGERPTPVGSGQARVAGAVAPRAEVSPARYNDPGAHPPSDLAELRRQQAEFEKTRRDISRENSWMAAVALAPAAAVLSLEADAAAAARLAPEVVSRGPLVLTERMPYLRVGHNWATRAGQRADKYYKAMADAKDGWKPEPRILDKQGKMLKPDIGTPPRTSDPNVRNYIEVKPNTPTGRAAAAKQVKKYKDATGRRVRALFYDPKKFM